MAEISPPPEKCDERCIPGDERCIPVDPIFLKSFRLPPFFPASDPTQWLFQEPPVETPRKMGSGCKFLQNWNHDPLFRARFRRLRISGGNWLRVFPRSKRSSCCFTFSALAFSRSNPVTFGEEAPISPHSVPPQWLFQGPPGESKFLAAKVHNRDFSLQIMHCNVVFAG